MRNAWNTIDTYQLCLSSWHSRLCAIAEDSRSRYVARETRSAIGAALLVVVLMLGVCDKVL
jgi:hypothetical protein